MTQKELLAQYEVAVRDKYPGNEKFVQYEVKSVAHIVELPDQTYFVIEKPTIETQFYFGESGYDYDEVFETACRCQNSEEYFMTANLRKIDRLIEECDRTDIVMRKCFGYYRGEIGVVGFDAGETFDKNCYKSLTDDEIKAIRNGYLEVRKRFEKRLKAYLKRYGLSKVRTHIYWRDE